MIRFGVIGAGNIARTFCDAMQVVEEGSLYAIASRDLTRAQDYQRTYGFDKAYESYETLFQDPNVDCVYVATPHGLHYEQMMLALDYKKHLLCEKAFTLNEAQAQAVFDKARAQGCFVMEAMWTRFLPTIQALQGALSEGVLGEITRVEAALCFDLQKPDDHRVLAKALGGGALLDVGIYPITFANLVLGAPSSFEATMTPASTGVDGSNEMTYHYPKAVAVLKSSVLTQGDPTARIEGTKGYAVVPNFWSTTQATLYDWQDQVLMSIDMPHEVNGFEYEIREVIQRLHAGDLESAWMSHQTTLAILKQMDAIRARWNLTYPQENT